LFVVEEGMENVMSYSDHIVQLVQANISRIIDAESARGSQSLLASLVNLYYNDQWTLKKASFSLVNSQDGRLVTVGSVLDGIVTRNGSPIQFLGGSTEVPTLSKVPMPIKVCLGDADADGRILPFLPALRFSYLLPVLEINASDEVLPNFTLAQTYFGIGIFYYDP
jgi:hypothetical protein